MEQSTSNQSSSSFSMSEDQSTSSSQSALFSLPTDQSQLFNSNSKGDDSDSAEEDSETYFFESDHMALRGNRDYQMMLRTIATLEAQRIQAVKDLDTLYVAQEEALADPIQFVDKLQRGLDLKLPKQQQIASLPHINWEKYTSQLDFSSLGAHRHMTRLKRNLVETNEETSTVVSQLDTDAMVRGRVKKDSKPQTFNQLWNVEEQKRLEDLLMQYPPEEVEATRWKKIASALGNRTPIQVQSRVQKYFIKLVKAGLPVPGRLPNTNIYKKKSLLKKRFEKYRGFYHQPSTFMHAYTPPVYMSDDDDDSQGCYGDKESVISGGNRWEEEGEGSVSDEESVPLELRESDEYRELMLLKNLRQERLAQSDGPGGTSEHVGFKCDRCDCEPIVGTRWHCTDCPPDVAVDFCDDCVNSPYETEAHNSSHRLKPKRSSEPGGFMDSDYLGFMPAGSVGGYNYLDPNYMPAS